MEEREKGDDEMTVLVALLLLLLLLLVVVALSVKMKDGTGVLGLSTIFERHSKNMRRNEPRYYDSLYSTGLVVMLLYCCFLN